MEIKIDVGLYRARAAVLAAAGDFISAGMLVQAAGAIAAQAESLAALAPKDKPAGDGATVTALADADVRRQEDALDLGQEGGVDLFLAASTEDKERPRVRAMPITIGSPPARRTVTGFDVRAVRFAVGVVSARVRAADVNGDEVLNVEIEVRANLAQGVRYRADGGVEVFSTAAAAATQPVAAAAAFAGANIAARLAALEVWLQTAGLLPT